MESIVDYLSSSYAEITAKLIGKTTQNPCVHISHEDWENYSDIPFGPSFYLVIKRDFEKNREILHIQTATYRFVKKIITPLQEFSYGNCIIQESMA